MVGSTRVHRSCTKVRERVFQAKLLFEDVCTRGTFIFQVFLIICAFMQMAGHRTTGSTGQSEVPASTTTIFTNEEISHRRLYVYLINFSPSKLFII